MTIQKITIAITTSVLFISALVPAAFANDSNNERLFTVMDGNQEVPPGDPYAIGLTRLQLNPNDGKICANLRVSLIDKPTAAHIHKGITGEEGPVVVTLPTPDSQGKSNGCVNVSKEKIQDISNNPSHYYVNVHDAIYPDGAIRGQL